VINAPQRKIGKTTVERLSEHAMRRGLALMDAARGCRHVESLSQRSAARVAGFVALFDRLVPVVHGPIEEILGHVLAETGYRDQYAESDTEEDQQRLANIEELLSVGRDFDERHPGGGHLEEFLEEVCLVSETDDWQVEADRVTLMTLHASKGLEFPVVYLVAAEQGLLPHERSRDHFDQLEEERRLMFVGITRAQQELQISLAQYRDFRGQRKLTIPSQFLMELPREEMQLEEVGPAIVPAPDDAAQKPQATAATTARPRRSVARLTTAAELAGQDLSLPVAPDGFRQGTVVRHPDFGLGKVIALSGSGQQRKATVEFAPPVGRRKFVLSQSPLRPVAAASADS
jgi:DNA helicase-2/ATP-dependent DNA helicase PcrA